MNRQLTLARIVVVACAVAVVPVMNPSIVGANPIDDQREKVEQITDELERLEQESDILAEDYVTAIDEKNQLDAEVADAEERVGAKQAEVEALRGELSEVAVRAFASSGTDALGPMFSDSASYTDDLQRDQLSRVALSTGTATTDELDHAVSDLEAEEAALDETREEAGEQAERVEQARVANDERKAEYTQARADAEAELGDLIREEEERRARESYERMQREAEAAAAAQAAAEAQALAEAQQAAAAQEAAVAQQQAAQDATAASQSQQSNGDGSSQQSSSGGSSSSSGGSSQEGQQSSSGGGPTQQSSSGGGSTQQSSQAQPNALASATPVRPPPPPPPVVEEEEAPPPPPPQPQIPQASSRAGTAINAAMTQLGVPWIFAMAKPGVGFDCSGLTSWAWGQAGVYLPHQSRAQYGMLPHVPTSAAQPGDLLFFYSPISHVSIYLGGGQQVHAPNSGTTVKTATVNWGNVVGVGRPG